MEASLNESSAFAVIIDKNVEYGDNTTATESDSEIDEVDKNNNRHKCDDSCEGKFPLHDAAYFAKYDDFERILKSHTANLWEKDCEGNTVLINLCDRIDPDDDDDQDDSVYIINEDMVEMFMKYIVEEGRSKEVIKQFVNTQSVSDDMNTALHIAAELRVVKVVKLLLENGADASLQNKFGSAPLHELTERRSKEAFECTELLLDAMIKKDIVNNEHQTALELAIIDFANTSAETVQLMISKGCSPCPLITINKETGKTMQKSILHEAVMAPRWENVESYESFGAFVKALPAKLINKKSQDSIDYATARWDGKTALHYAAYYLDANIMEQLFTNEKINVCATDPKGRTALHIIALNGWNTGSEKCVKMLMKAAGNDKKRERLFEQTDDGVDGEDGKTAFDISVSKDSVPLSKVIMMSLPDFAVTDWMGKERLKQIYKKVPEILLPILNNSINYVGKNYEANDETFSANIEELYGPDNNVYDKENNKYPKVLKRETDYLNILFTSPYVDKAEMESFLSHPIVSLFIQEKWKKLRGLYWCGMLCKILWLFSYLAFTIHVFWYSFPFEVSSGDDAELRNSVENEVDAGNKGEDGLTKHQKAYAIIIMASNVTIFALKLLLTFYTVGKKALTVNCLIQFLFTGFSCATLASLCIEGVLDWHYVATAISIIWISFIWMWDLRDFPYIGKYADVFFIALKNLIRLVISFVPLLVGFSIAIGLMLRENESFRELHWNPIKILVMMLGEINFDDIFNESSPSRTFSLLIVTLFVITVPIVMFNLLLGFTVSDVQALKSEGELKVRISTLELTIILETLVLSPPIQKMFSSAFLWRFLMELETPRPEHEELDWKLQINMKMEEIPSEIRLKIREIARNHQVQKSK